MSEPKQFFQKIRTEDNDIDLDLSFSGEVVESVFFGFLERNYIALKPEHFTEYNQVPDSTTVEELSESFKELQANNFIIEVDGGYKLNKNKEHMRSLQDKLIEYKIGKKYES